ncbi:hypothetical protein V1498_09765 [Peribacillus sp. SCS-26]|uniref:hypothetical protein n=1 Tax=Paraperibacillus marinus TaxID=3115295 RepID=UPI0039069D20
MKLFVYSLGCILITYLPLMAILYLGSNMSASSSLTLSTFCAAGLITVADHLILKRAGVLGAALAAFFITLFIVGIGLDLSGVHGAKAIFLTLLSSFIICGLRTWLYGVVKRDTEAPPLSL